MVRLRVLPRARRTAISARIALVGVAALVGFSLLPAQAAPAAEPVAGQSAAPAPATTRPADPIAHDPTMVKEGAWWYVIITGDSATHTYLPVKRSKDLLHWEELGPVFTTLPSWVTSMLGTTPADAWAPDLHWQGDHWALYYAASQFGTNNSVIGLATTKSLDPASPNFGWHDQGLVLRTRPGVDNVNAIDPEYVRDAQGRSWLAFGSFWDGIGMRRLDDATGKLSATDTALRMLASRGGGPIEGASIVRHGGYYYLFVAFDYCCRGVNSDYRVMVGRSTSVTGPYVDATGKPMLQGGGTEVLRGYNEFIGTGGADVYVHNGVDWFVNHYYDATDNGAPKLNVRTLHWSHGWPEVSDPVNPSRWVGHGDAYVKLIERNSGLPIEDIGCGYESANVALAVDSSSTCQQWQFVSRGGATFSIGNRFSNRVAEVQACDNRDGGNVAQWGWIGFLPNNDCQRWTPVDSTDGWTHVQSVLPGSRLLDAAGCGTAPGTNIDVLTASASACQNFRFQPVGRVLLADPNDRQAVFAPADCRPGSVRVESRHTAPNSCAQWTFTSVGGAAYAVSNAATGTLLGTSRCTSTHPERSRLRLVKGGGHPECRQWYLQPQADGTWALTNVGNGSTHDVRLALP